MRRRGANLFFGWRTAPDRPPSSGDPLFDACSSGYEYRVSTHHVNLSPQEQSLIAESHPEALSRMDENNLKELQTRLRHAREKNFSMLRRQGAARVQAEGARGAAQPANEKRGEKVEVFDEAIKRVTERLDAIHGAD